LGGLPPAAHARLPLLRLTVAAAAGGSQDVFARLLAEGVGRRLGVRVLVENRPGAGGLVGFAALARQPADGLHLGVGGDQQALLPAWTPPGATPPDLDPVAMGVETPMVLLGRLEGPADIGALAAAARLRSMSVGTGGVASLSHLAQEGVRAALDVAWQAVPYRGGAPAAQDLLTGALDAALVAGGVAAPLLRAGLVRGLLVLRADPDPLLPGVPALAAAGLPAALAVSGWHGLVAPRGVAPARLSAVADALREEVWAQAMPLAAAGLRPAPGGAAEMAQRISADARRFGPVAQALAHREGGRD
jgi:tripartite-type tricarboxylate transporter receptor subunit TctC